jgi:transposase-like protein
MAAPRPNKEMVIVVRGMRENGLSLRKIGALLRKDHKQIYLWSHYLLPGEIPPVSMK